MNKKMICTAAAALTVCLTGCGSKIGSNDSSAVRQEAAQTTTAAVTSLSPTESSSDSAAPVITTAADKEIKTGELPYAEYSVTLEAEDQELAEGLSTEATREGFSGKGYVKGLDETHSVKFSFDLPESQYYNITATVASEDKCLCSAVLNGTALGTFEIASDSGFTIVTFSNIKLDKGTVTLEIGTVSGQAELDSVNITSSTEIKDIKLSLESFALSNKDADYNAKALYQYLCEGYGKRVITGQHDTVGTNTETKRIYELTGHWPAIRFGDLMPITQENSTVSNEIELAEKWAAEGGIVSYMWHWADPIGGEKYYSDETDFDLSKAVTAEDIALLGMDELEKLCTEKKISSECLAIIKDIDAVSAELAKLRDKGIAVIWRPLHEASNGYFWWGHDPESYKWLWNLLYQRQTGYHKLNNLIWVWSAQNSGWYVGDARCDMISADIYDQGNLSGHAERLAFLQKISSAKPIVMSECGTTPDIEKLAEENALWGFVGQWGGSFLIGSDNSINKDHNDPDDLIAFYSNNITVTREELPDFAAQAKELEAADIKKAEEAKKAEEEKKAAEAEKEKSSDTSDSKTDEPKS